MDRGFGPTSYEDACPLFGIPLHLTTSEVDNMFGKRPASRSSLKGKAAAMPANPFEAVASTTLDAVTRDRLDGAEVIAGGDELREEFPYNPTWNPKGSGPSEEDPTELFAAIDPKLILFSPTEAPSDRLAEPDAFLGLALIIPGPKECKARPESQGESAIVEDIPTNQTVSITQQSVYSRVATQPLSFSSHLKSSKSDRFFPMFRPKSKTCQSVSENPDPKRNVAVRMRKFSNQLQCYACGTTSTSLWRKIKDQDACNACSLYYKLHGLMRPPELRLQPIRRRRRQFSACS